MQMISRIYHWAVSPNRISRLRSFLDPWIVQFVEGPRLEGSIRRQRSRHGETEHVRPEFAAEVHTILQNIPPKSLIIDVGSNIGNFVEIFLRRGYSVLSIDPLEPNIEKQKMKFEYYLAEGKLRLCNVACSDKDGYATLFVSSDPDGCFSSLEERWTREVFPGCCKGKTESVRTERLEALIRHSGERIENISCVKIDTEGFEDKVLAGMFDGLRYEWFPKLIMFEFNTHRSDRPVFERCLSILRDYGYGVFKYFIRHGELLLHESKWIQGQINIGRWDRYRGSIPAMFRYGNVIAKRQQCRKDTVKWKA